MRLARAIENDYRSDRATLARMITDGAVSDVVDARRYELDKILALYGAIQAQHAAQPGVGQVVAQANGLRSQAEGAVATARTVATATADAVKVRLSKLIKSSAR